MPYKDKRKEKERWKKYYEKNETKITEQRKQWWEDNPEYQKKYNKEYYIENKVKLLEYQKQHNKTENGKANHQRANTKRRARMREIINTLTTEEWLNILKEHNYKCVYCGCEFGEDTLPTKDHIIPISKGGDNIKENIIPACRSCNSRKRDKILNIKRGGKR